MPTETKAVKFDHAAAIEALRGRAIELCKGRRMGLATDAGTYAQAKKPTVLIALAHPHASLVIAMDAAQYDAEEIAKLAGFLPTPARMLHVKSA